MPFFVATINGVSQIMLQRNLLTGFLFLVGLAFGNATFTVGALAGSFIGALTARLLRYDASEIETGLYGFSAALVGVALPFMFQASVLLWALVAIGSVTAAVLQHYFIVRKIPAYTFPFVLVTWLLVFFVRQTGLALPVAAASTLGDAGHYAVFLSATNGFGEVIFQSHTFAGLLFFIAVFIANPVAAVYALAASLLGGFTALHFGHTLEDIQLGLFGFNAVLTAIAFADAQKIAAVWIVLGVLMTLVIHLVFVRMEVFQHFGGVLTFPFVVGAMLTHSVKTAVIQVSGAKLT